MLREPGRKVLMRPQILSFYCEVKDKLGNMLSSSFNRDVRAPADESEMDGALDLPFKRVMMELKGMRKGQSREIHLSAEEAYGFYDDRLVMTVPMTSFEVEEPLELGSEVVTEDEIGGPQVFRVVSLSNLGVTLDGNHPLAGQDLVVHVQVVASRIGKNERPMPERVFVSSSGRILH